MPSSYYYYYFHWATVVTLRGKEVPSHVFLHVCDLFSYENVNVNMYFEAVCFLKVHLAIDVLT